MWCKPGEIIAWRRSPNEHRWQVTAMNGKLRGIFKGTCPSKGCHQDGSDLARDPTLWTIVDDFDAWVAEVRYNAANETAEN